jgi:hypothetical protein
MKKKKLRVELFKDELKSHGSTIKTNQTIVFISFLFFELKEFSILYYI